MLARDLDQAVGVGRVPRADHEHEVALARQLLDRRLAVRRRVTDVVGAGTDDRREALAQPVDDRAGLVDRQRGLGDVGDLARVAHLERVDVLLVLDQHDVLGRLPHRALDLLVARRGRRARSCSPRRRTSSPRRGPWSRAGRSRRSSAGRGRRALACTLGATPWAENTTVAPSGTSVSDSTNTAPRSRSCSTTCLLWTISLRTYTGAPCSSSARSTVCTARSTPAQ